MVASLANERRRVKEIVKVLRREYPEATCSLTHRDPFELIMAVILSAQCTDERVNQVTPALFKRLGTPEKMAAAPVQEIEGLIRSVNFYRNKAVALKESSRAIMEEHHGQVPNELEELIKLRGVGRKTANVILGVAFGKPALVVDTHVGRLSRRLGLTKKLEPEKVEQDLMKVVPEEDWTDLAHLLIFHGRAICTARRAYCERCAISRYCPKVGVSNAYTDS